MRRRLVIPLTVLPTLAFHFDQLAFRTFAPLADSRQAPQTGARQLTVSERRLPLWNIFE